VSEHFKVAIHLKKGQPDGSWGAPMPWISVNLKMVDWKGLERDNIWLNLPVAGLMESKSVSGALHSRKGCCGQTHSTSDDADPSALTSASPTGTTAAGEGHLSSSAATTRSRASSLAATAAEGRFPFPLGGELFGSSCPSSAATTAEGRFPSSAAATRSRASSPATATAAGQGHLSSSAAATRSRASSPATTGEGHFPSSAASTI
jgi:hypothetical protein